MGYEGLAVGGRLERAVRQQRRHQIPGDVVGGGGGLWVGIGGGCKTR
jgi:hypothetical protein